MEPNIQNSSGMLNGMPPMPKQEKKVGPIIAVLVIVLILIIVALIFFGKNLNTKNNPVPATTNQNTVMRNEAAVSNRIDETSLDNDLDKQLNDIDYSF